MFKLSLCDRCGAVMASLLDAARRWQGVSDLPVPDAARRWLLAGRRGAGGAAPAVASLSFVVE